MPLTSVPNLLTLSRILAIPLVVASFYVAGDYARWFACALFSGRTRARAFLPIYADLFAFLSPEWP